MNAPKTQAGPLQKRNTSRSFRSSGFSLVEVVMALGIISFAIVPLVGMMPIGLSNFRGSMDRSVSTQIAQLIINEARQAGFANLSLWQGNRYFTDEGEETTAESATKVYVVRTDVTAKVEVPSAESAFSNASLAQVRVRVANSPTGAISVATGTGPNVQDFTAYIPKM